MTIIFIQINLYKKTQDFLWAQNTIITVENRTNRNGLFSRFMSTIIYKDVAVVVSYLHDSFQLRIEEKDKELSATMLVEVQGIRAKEGNLHFSFYRLSSTYISLLNNKIYISR